MSMKTWNCFVPGTWITMAYNLSTNSSLGYILGMGIGPIGVNLPFYSLEPVEVELLNLYLDHKN